MMKKLLILSVIALVGFAGWRVYHHSHLPTKVANSTAKASEISQKAASSRVVSNFLPCASNVSGQKIVVSISKQHVWACNGRSSIYDSAAITGMQLYPSELTPVGSYAIYAKQTNQTLAGHDFTGSWNDFVYYWMPFLNNKYGTYGFHDLTTQANGKNGRADSDFGTININAPYTAAKHGSHGCVEMPLAGMKWLYNWAEVGTKVSVVS